MKVDGKLVKRKRKELKMTQNQLAEGICKQATISNIEKRNKANSMTILVKLCTRLDLSIDQIITQSVEEVGTKKQLQTISKKIDTNKLSEAKKLVKALAQKENDLTEIYKCELNLYQGYLAILDEKNESMGLFYLNEILLSTEGSLAIYRVLASAVLLKFYTSKQMLLQAKSFIDNVQKELEHVEGLDSDQRFTLFYYEAADYCQQAGDFKKGLDFCEKGLSLCVNNFSLINLDKLVEKKAELLQELSDSTAVSEFDFAERLKELIK